MTNTFLGIVGVKLKLKSGGIVLVVAKGIVGTHFHYNIQVTKRTVTDG